MTYRKAEYWRKKYERADKRSSQWHDRYCIVHSELELALSVLGEALTGVFRSHLSDALEDTWPEETDMEEDAQ